MDQQCTCGHVEDEHGYRDPRHPRAMECTVDGCDCIAFEADDETEAAS